MERSFLIFPDFPSLLQPQHPPRNLSQSLLMSANFCSHPPPKVLAQGWKAVREVLKKDFAEWEELQASLKSRVWLLRVVRRGGLLQRAHEETSVLQTIISIQISKSWVIVPQNYGPAVSRGSGPARLRYFGHMILNRRPRF
jgi:hypothetical protein